MVVSTPSCTSSVHPDHKCRSIENFSKYTFKKHPSEARATLQLHKSLRENPGLMTDYLEAKLDQWGVRWNMGALPQAGAQEDQREVVVVDSD